MPRYAPLSGLASEVTLGRLVSLGSERAIAKARQAGLPVPDDVRPSARASIDPVTGRLYSRTATQTATTFHDPKLSGRFRTMREALPKKAARERLLLESGLTFEAGDWTSRYERDLRVQAIEKAYRARVRAEGRRPGRIYERGSEFRQALTRLSDATPPNLKTWHRVGAAREKIRALETLGMRPKGWDRLPGTYTKAELAAAWQASGQQQPRFAYKRDRERERRRRIDRQRRRGKR